LPKSWTPQPAAFLAALHEVCECGVAGSGGRYAVHRVQLRGTRGELVGTDTHQILAWAGWSLPFTDDVIVTRPTLLGSPEFAAVKAGKLGRTATHVVIDTDGWTVWLAIDKGGRFPDVEPVMPKPERFASRLRLDRREAEVLATALPRLPANNELSSPVTVDLGETVTIRAKADSDSGVTALPLRASIRYGEQRRFEIDRTFLARACKLGLHDIGIVNKDKPALAADGKRRYVFMMLAGEGIAAAPNTQVVSLEDFTAKSKAKTRTTTKAEPAQPVPAAATTRYPVQPTSDLPTAKPRPGMFDTLRVGSSWLLTTMRLGKLARTN
jgi:hypothetical protein